MNQNRSDPSRDGKEDIRPTAWRFLPLIAQIVWILLIWSFSLFSGSDSADQSGWVVSFIQPLTDWLGIADPSLFIRKAAHFTEYAILGILSAFGRQPWPLLVPGLPVAVVDEQVIQRFLAQERGPSWGDVALDYVGYLCGFALARFISKAIVGRSCRE